MILSVVLLVYMCMCAWVMVFVGFLLVLHTARAVTFTPRSPATLSHATVSGTHGLSRAGYAYYCCCYTIIIMIVMISSF